MGPEYDAANDILRDGHLAVSRRYCNDGILAVAYLKMQAEKTIDTVFYNSVPSISSFLRTYTDPERIVLGCFDHDPTAPLETAELCGLGWATRPEVMGGFSKAECGMVFFTRNRRNPKTNVALGKLMLRYYFDNSGIDIIYGTTPEPNRIALRYAQKLGFSLHGPIPNFATWRGQLAPVWVSHMSKAEFLERGR